MSEFGPAHPSNLSAAWNAFYPPKYRINAETVKRQVFGGSLLIPEAASAWEFGAVFLKKSGTPSWFPGQDPERGHVSLFVFTQPEEGAKILKGSFEAGRAAGLRRLVFGMDPDHLLPGCPVECDALRTVLRECGFSEGGGYFDLERDLDTYEVPPECASALASAGAKVEACRIEDLAALDDFMAREFPSRWRHDVMRKATTCDEAGQVCLLWIGGQIEGFAMTQFDGCKRPIGGAVWHESLGPKWGALGPIGVSKSVRGKGLGDALLGKSLERLQQCGARQTIIDWTTLEDFYGRHGFKVTRRYLGFAREL